MTTHSLLQEYFEILQLFLKDDHIRVMHSSFSVNSATITIDSAIDMTIFLYSELHLETHYCIMTIISSMDQSIDVHIVFKMLRNTALTLTTWKS